MSTVLYSLVVSVCLAGQPCKDVVIGGYNTPTACMIDAQHVISEILSDEERAEMPKWTCKPKKN